MALKSGMKIVDETGMDKKISKKDALKNTEVVAKNWIDQNSVLLQNGILGMDEFKRYVYKRSPGTKVGKFLGLIISVWRHLDLLIAGMCPFLNEIDHYIVEQYMSHEIKTSWGMGRASNMVFADFYKKKSVTAKGVVNVEGRPVRIKVDGGKPLPEIGVQMIDLQNEYDHNAPKEWQIVEYLLQRPDKLANLNMIALVVDEDINILSERLLYMHQQGAVQCKRFFDIFNSKNYANLNPKLGGK